MTDEEIEAAGNEAHRATMVGQEHGASSSTSDNTAA